MEIFIRTEKILVVANDFSAFTTGIINRCWRRISCGTIHLHLVLMKDIKDVKSQLVIVTGFLFLSYLFEVNWLMNVALVLGLIFVISPALSKAVLWFWEKLALVLGWINTRIILSLVFYLFLLPIALLFKLFNRDPLSMNWNNTSSSFIVRDHEYKAVDLENPW